MEKRRDGRKKKTERNAGRKAGRIGRKQMIKLGKEDEKEGM